MSLVNTLTQRPRQSRAPADTVSDLLARPLPPAVDKLRSELAEARAAYERATGAMEAALGGNTAQRLEAAEWKLRRLEVASDVSGPLGSGAPAPEEIEAAERELNAARTAHVAKDEIAALYREAIEGKRQALDEVHARLTQALASWKAPLLDAIEAELADAANRANAALATLRAVDALRNNLPRVRIPKVAPAYPDDFHVGNEVVAVPEQLTQALADWRRTQRILMRT